MKKDSDLPKAMAAAIAEGIAARSAFYAAMAEPDMQSLGQPATIDQLSALEAVFGEDLPPSYKEFLCRHNGWKMFDAATDLYSTDQILKAAKSKSLEKWRQIAVEVEGIDAANWLQIGGSKETAVKYFIDPKRRSADGELFVVEHNKAVESEYKSFLEMLLESNDVYRQGLGDIDGGYDFTNV